MERGGDVRIRPIEPVDVERIVLLHREWFPVKYADDFYTNLTHNLSSSTPTFAIVAVRTEDEEVVGALTAQIFKEWQAEDTNLLSFSLADHELMYITTLGVTQEYRKRGIATMLLDSLLEFCMTQRHSIKAVYLHVLTTNDAALGFYEKQKFVRARKLDAYYDIDGRLLDSFLYILYLNNGQPPGRGNILDFCYWKVGQVHQMAYSMLSWFC